MTSNKVILSCAIRGSIQTPSMSPHLSLGDLPWLDKGVLAPSNAAQVTRVRQVIEGLGLEIAAPTCPRHPRPGGRRSGRVLIDGVGTIDAPPRWVIEGARHDQTRG